MVDVPTSWMKTMDPMDFPPRTMIVVINSAKLNSSFLFLMDNKILKTFFFFADLVLNPLSKSKML